ncbi:MAG: ABC transporter permease [Candidatus Aminicenantes bacterium]|nr:ABC transporter permease [Candidatus Aminicenantes bacterium]
MKRTNPPKFAERILSILSFSSKIGILGDTEEEYRLILSKKGRFKADMWYVWQILKPLPFYIRSTIYWSYAMFKSYLKIGIRNLKKFKSFTFINITGLSIGIACTLLIALFIKNELSYDRFHHKLDNIYRLSSNWHKPDGSVVRYGSVPIPMGPLIKEYFVDDIRFFARVCTMEFTVRRGDFLENLDVTLTDEAFFKLFTFPLLNGNPSHVLSSLNSVVLSEILAKRYFGNENPLGKRLTLIMGEYRDDFIVSAVANDPPNNSSINYSLLININCLGSFRREDFLSNWNVTSPNWQTFIEVMDSNSPRRITNGLPQFTKLYISDQDQSFTLQRMRDIHFDQSDTGTPDLTKIYILSAIAFFILLTAVINFVTISVGNASYRFREIGIRKLVGAKRKQLMGQFWIESIFITAVAVFLAVMIARVLLPVFNTFTNKSLVYSDILSPSNIAVLFLFTMIVGISVGSYPAFILSKFKPFDLFKGKQSLSGKNSFTRILVIMQFSLSIILIVVVIGLSRQIRFILNDDYGFNRENVIIVETHKREVEPGERLYEKFRNRLLNQADIIRMSSASGSFDKVGIGRFLYNGHDYKTSYMRVNFDYFKTIELDLVEGRDFSHKISSDMQALVVNESLVQTLGLKKAVGTQIRYHSRIFTIIGVVRDSRIYGIDTLTKMHRYNKNMAEHRTLPALYYINPIIPLRYILIKISPYHLSETLDRIRAAWTELEPDKPFSWSFLEEDIEAQVLDENRWKNIVLYSSLLAVFVACLGVFGLTSISVARRVKEIGIRKVHGATVSNVVGLLTKEFIKWVILANVIAWPAAWYVLHKWLQNYAYRIGISPAFFMIAAFSMVSVVLLTTSALTIKAALANPADSLRYE